MILPKIYYVNTDSEHNEQARLLRKTAPKGWSEMPWPLPGDGLDGRYPDDRDRAWPPSEKWDTVGAQGGKKYFLLSDDREKNSQRISVSSSVGQENTPDEPVIPAAFYIRGQEEKISPFIDTALARMGSRIIPVQILDDDKIAARVLARHPLFYPIRSLRQNQQARLNFVVIGPYPLLRMADPGSLLDAYLPQSKYHRRNPYPGARSRKTGKEAPISLSRHRQRRSAG